jgi:hypothetical protein
MPFLLYFLPVGPDVAWLKILFKSQEILRRYSAQGNEILVDVAVDFTVEKESNELPLSNF